MEKLAIFDVDYTLTKKETSIELFKYVLKKDPKKIIYLPRALFSGLLYIMGIYDEKKSKESFFKFIDGLEEANMEKLVKDFYRNRLKNIIYDDAIAMMRKLKSEGCKIYLISASPEFYLKELYSLEIVDKIIGTRYACTGGFHSRTLEGLNCKGEEKVRRLMEELKKDNIKVDFKNSYMFSDSLSDKPLFDLVGNAFLINYKKNHDTIKILRWK
ncbi:HAD family hydrolase [Alloiococcus sp. CFN-8]|uniref:HAD family hydrolase n=1 Tax=Alloiococcus sp. CFN-8 TaxID=3416081 RepID=UPI003CEF58D3